MKYHLTINILLVLYVYTLYRIACRSIAPEATSMESTKNTTRRDVIQNAVSHQIQELEGSGRSRRALATLFSSELNHAPQQVQAILERLGPETRVEPALTDSGTYRGSVVVETAHELIQRISLRYAVIHRKDDLDSRPESVTTCASLTAMATATCARSAKSAVARSWRVESPSRIPEATRPGIHRRLLLAS